MSRKRTCIVPEDAETLAGAFCSRRTSLGAEAASLAPRDVLLLYSDGMANVRSASGEVFGDSRLMNLLAGLTALGVSEIVERMLNKLHEFADSLDLPQELMCTVVKFDDSAVPEIAFHAEKEVASALAELATVRGFVREANLGIPVRPLAEEEVELLELGANEAAANVIRHAHCDQPGQRIRLCADARAGRLLIRLYYLGKAFEPGNVTLPDIDGYRQGGYGLYIIAKSADEVSYSCDRDGRNCISLLKHGK